MSTRIERTGEAFRVNTRAEDRQNDAVVASLAGGGFVVIWEDHTFGTGRESVTVKAQLHDSDGQKVGAEFLVPTNTGQDQASPAVARLADGGFVICWTDYSGTLGDTDGASIKLQVFEADGTRRGGERLVNVQTAGNQVGASVTALADGGFVVGWYNTGFDGAVPRNVDAWGRLFTAAGEASTGEIRLNQVTEKSQGYPVFASLDDGRFVTAWSDDRPIDGDADAGNIRAQLFAQDGVRIGAEIEVNTPGTGYALYPQVVDLPGGGFVVAWLSMRKAGDDYKYSIQFQLFDATGNREGDPVDAFDPPVASCGDLSALALPSGAFILAWSSGSGFGLADEDGESANVYAQVFGPDGARSGALQRLNPSQPGDQYSPSIAVLDDGRLIVSWTDTGGTLGDASEGAIHAQFFDTRDTGPGDDRVDLTQAAGDSEAAGEGNDTYLVDDRLDQPLEAPGEGLDTVIATLSWTLGANLENLVLDGSRGINGTGNGRNNDLQGNAGANELLGLDGDDTLSGGDGNDTVNGGAGADHLSGGTGDDHYIVTGNDTVNEMSGAGHDTIVSGVDWTLGAGLEDVLLRGGSRVAGTGNSDANLLRGNKASNRLSGLDGEDLLLGREGADILAGGGADDVLDGGPGADLFRFDALAGGVDVIVSFTLDKDRIELDDDVFSAFNASITGRLGRERFHSGDGETSAADADDRIVYDTATGILYYDADGAGGVPSVPFAIVGESSHPALRGLDFVIAD